MKYVCYQVRLTIPMECKTLQLLPNQFKRIFEQKQKKESNEHFHIKKIK